MGSRRGWPAIVLAVASIAIGSLSAAGGTRASAAAQEPSAVEADVYEADNTPEQAHPLLLVGIPQRRTFHTGNDNDWAYVSAEAGERVVLFTTGSCDTVMQLYAPDGETLLAQDDDGGGGANAAIRFRAPVSTEYFVRVRLFSPASGPCEEYELVGRVLPPPAADSLEPDTSPTSAKPLPTDGSRQEHTLHVEGDEDWVSFKLPANTGVRLLTEGPCDTYLYLYAPDGRTILAEDDDSGQLGGSLISYTLIEAETYYARVRHFDESSGVCDAYSISLSLTPPTLRDAFEPDDSSTQATPLSPTGVPQTHTIHLPADTDWVSFTLAANDRLFLFTEGECDTYLHLYTRDGRTVVAENDDSGEGGNAAIFFKVPEAGTYYARVRLFGEAARTCSSYDLIGVALTVRAGPTPAPGATSAPGIAGTATVAPATATPRPTLGPAPISTPGPTAKPTQDPMRPPR